MVSLAYVFTILSIFSALALAEDVKPSQPESVEEKWRYGWGGRWGYRYGYRNYLGFYGIGSNCALSYPWVSNYGCGACGVFYWPSLWFKDVNNPPAARRALTLDAERIYRREEPVVACKDQNGKVQHYLPADCHGAVSSMVSKKTSSASCNSCAAHLVSQTGLVVATGVPVEDLHRVTDNILKSCSSGALSAATKTRRSPGDSANSAGSKRQVALIFSKGDGTKCDA